MHVETRALFPMTIHEGSLIFLLREKEAVNEFKLIQQHSFPCEEEGGKGEKSRYCILLLFFFCFSFELVEDQRKIISALTFQPSL